jgi:hypothetical protein
LEITPALSRHPLFDRKSGSTAVFMAAVVDADGRSFDMIAVSRSDQADVASPAAGLTQPAKRIWRRESSRESA